MPQSFNVVLVKGRSNYISLRRLLKAQQRVASFLAEDRAIRQLLEIGRWTRQTQDGSRSDLSFQPLPPVWELVESDTGNCLGRNCPQYDQCFYYRARRRIHGAQILVVNHALFFSDLALRRQGANLLPDYRTVIFDEAHTLEDVAADHLGLQLSRGSVDYLLNKLYHERGSRAHGLLVIHSDERHWHRSTPPARPPNGSSMTSAPGSRTAHRAQGAAARRAAVLNPSGCGSRTSSPIRFPQICSTWRAA
jgi:ATP-dependent DNA helicase DinG